MGLIRSSAWRTRIAVLLHTKEGEKGSRSKGVKSMVKSCFLSPWTWKRNERAALDDLALATERENIRNLESVSGRPPRKFAR